MKRFFLLGFLLLGALTASAQEFGDYFYDKALRFNFQHAGSYGEEHYYFDGLTEEPFWAGPKDQLVDPFDYGNQKFAVVDAASGKEIFSQTYCTLFNEWQVTDEAKSGVYRAFPEAVVFPYPKNKVRIEFYNRDAKNNFVKRYEQTIDPDDYFIARTEPKGKVVDILYNGNPSEKLDIVIVPEGYAADELETFKADCRAFADTLFAYSPYKENKEKFNIRAVWIPSEDSGVSIPGEHIWKNTLLGAHFYTFRSERYLTAPDQQRLRDAAANAPYDYIYILTNTPKYGGGGIYRFYGISAAHHPSATGKVAVHEFGHQLLGLGDEYVEIGGQAEELYPLTREPWEENLTTLVDFGKKKIWNGLLEKDTPVPTPVNTKNEKRVGAYEGAGYLEKGVYRPMVKCMMKGFDTDLFCPVCTQSIQRMIDFYAK